MKRALPAMFSKWTRWRGWWFVPYRHPKAEELSSLLYELGLHLDCTAGYDITGG
jgi:hypothetical protein